jgi:hypothetical protein
VQTRVAAKGNVRTTMLLLLLYVVIVIVQIIIIVMILVQPRKCNCYSQENAIVIAQKMLWLRLFNSKEVQLSRAGLVRYILGLKLLGALHRSH